MLVFLFRKRMRHETDENRRIRSVARVEKYSTIMSLV